MLSPATTLRSIGGRGLGSSWFARLVLLLLLAVPASAADRYWVGGSGAWSETAHWSAASGDAGGASVPDADTTVIFDANSGGGTATVDVAALAERITLASGYDGTLAVGSGITLTLSGTGTTLTVAAGATLVNAGTLSISGTGPAISGTFTASAVGNLVRYTGQADNAAVTIASVAYHHLEVAKAGTTFTPAGGIAHELYAGIGGTAVSDLTSAGSYPGSPTRTSLITDWFEGPTDTADDYGSRMRTMVIPPTTGNYRFWIASDDASQLWVAPDGIAAHAVNVARVDAWTSPREWTREAGQRSAEIALVAGQPCFVMALHKEGSGGDHLAVGWTGPGALDERPIPAARCSGTLSVAGNLTIAAGSLDAASHSLSVGGNWTNAGGFVAGSGMVTLAGAGGSTQVISGSTTFHGLTATASAARTLQFAAGTTQTVTGRLVLTGASGQLLALTSTTPGAAWSLNPTGGTSLRTCRFLAVSDGINADAAFIAPADSIDGGNTVRWFLIANTWVADTAAVWSDPTKWSLGHVPTTEEAATFTSAHNGSCTADAASQSVGSLVFSAGYAGSFSLGGNLLEIASGDADFTGLTAVAGDGTLSFSANTGIQRLTPNGLNHGIISHSAAGTLSLAGDLSCRSLIQSAGQLDLNGHDLTCSGDLTITNGTASTLANLAGCSLVVGGDASFAGQAGNLLNLDSGIGAGWSIDVSGSLSASYAAIGSSDASGGTTGVATNSRDDGGNRNWGFGSALFYWHPSQPLASTDFNRAYNWTSGADGSGRRPASLEDDQFSQPLLDTTAWTYHDHIGDGHSSQSLAANTGQLTLTARGVDVWHYHHGYAGVWRDDLVGDAFDVTVHVESLTNTSSWALAGIFAMNDVTDPEAGGNILVAITPGEGATFYYAGTDNGDFDMYDTTPMTAPCYLRLTRNGTTFRAFCRKNLSDPWTTIGWAASPAGTAMAVSSQVMLFASSCNSGATCTAVFDDFQAGTAMSAPDNILSFDGTGSGSHDDATMSATQVAAAIDFSGPNGYDGTFDFNGQTLAIGQGTDVGAVTAGSADFANPLLTIASTGGGTLAFIDPIAHQLIPQAGGLFPHLLIGGSGSTVLADAASVEAVTIATAGAVTLSGSPLTVRSGSLSRSDVPGAEGLHLVSAEVVLGAAGTWTNQAAEGQLAIAGVVSGPFALTLGGVGTITLSGANTYTGGTTVASGTVAVSNASGSGCGSGAVQVNAGATLGGTGSIAGAVTVQSGGVLSPGAGGAGTLTLARPGAGALVLGAGAVLQVDLGTASDLVACSGASAGLTLDGTVNVSAAAGFAAGTFTILTYAGTLIDNGLVVGAVPAGYGAIVDLSVAGQVRLVCSLLTSTARETVDSDGNGRIDRIRITAAGSLNDDFSGVTATVAGYTVTGFSTGLTANDHEFFIVFAEGGSADTAATPAVRITANSTLRHTLGNGLHATDALAAAPIDTAKPVLISATWTDGDGNGVDAGDTVALGFSEPVSATSMVVGDLALAVVGDTFATSTLADQPTTATVTMVLDGAPQLTPGGSFAPAVTSAGAASGVYLVSGAHLSDAAANTGHVQGAGSAVDLGPTTPTALSLAWESGADPKAWAIGTIAPGQTANTVAAPDLRVRNLSTGAVQLLVKTAASAPSGWQPAGAAGTNAFLMRCDNTGTAAAGAGPTTAANYALTLTDSNQLLHHLVYSGTLADFELYFAAPSAITIGGGQQQTIVVTVTAQIPP